MRILHLIQRYHPARGGAEKHLEEISKYFAGVGHQVTVLTTDALDFELFWDPSRKRIAANKDTYGGVDILRFPVKHVALSQITYPGLRRLLSIMSKTSIIPSEGMMKIANFTPWVPGLWRWLKETEQTYDVVAGMTIGFEPIMAAGQTFAHKIGVPFVCYPLTHLGAGPEPGIDPISRFYTMRHQIKVVLDSDRVIAQTDGEQRFFTDRGLAKEKIPVVGPGVEPSSVVGGDGNRFLEKYRIRNPSIIFIGYLSRDKGAFDTVAAMQQLWRQGREVDLVLIGTISSTFRSYFDRFSDSERRRIHLLGPVGDSEKGDALAAASMLSMPSRTDSFGITYLEAWLYGLPVIAARTWGVTDIVDHGNDGLIVPFGDVNSLASAIETLLDDPGKARAMGEAGREKVYQEHRWEKKLQELGELYQGLAEQRSER